MIQLTSETKALGLLGHPVSHSKSPQMLNAAFSYHRLPYVYLAFDIAPDQLKEAVAGIKLLRFQGFNVTIPHKISIMDYLDEIDSVADAIGAVNTVIERNGRLIGTNTDGKGYLRSLEVEMGISVDQESVVMIGAGGAARAVGHALVSHGVKQLTILNRTNEKAEYLATHLSQWLPSIQVGTLKDGKKILENATCIINTTSVGMHPRIHEMPIEADWIPSHCIVSDLIYAPVKTALLKAAKAKGARIQNGLGMLLFQAAIAYEQWTNQIAPIEIMRQTLQK
ncbi:shikimate dehydrogenase [Seinonella peptonophila]|uniref:Shikimate dehydrogenase (NADP(+)) n=1 Tax=Seinonella peptonophila TaxID=112248 RepID=A0A1M4W7G7_9BACL|nr:shikimate dehydrogenase [Seinonella peptonophila]SHE77208.1 shikimate dehydrogenase [Seinonella peptonophila]